MSCSNGNMSILDLSKLLYLIDGFPHCVSKDAFSMTWQSFPSLHGIYINKRWLIPLAEFIYLMCIATSIKFWECKYFEHSSLAFSQCIRSKKFDIYPNITCVPLLKSHEGTFEYHETPFDRSKTLCKEDDVNIKAWLPLEVQDKKLLNHKNYMQRDLYLRWPYFGFSIVTRHTIDHSV